MNKAIVFSVLLFSVVSTAQQMTNEDLIQKSIQYHDPKGNWHTFKGTFEVENERSPVDLVINNATGTAYWTEVLKSGDTLTGGFLDKDSCIVRLNGKSIPPKGELENFLLDCENIIGRTNYWVYMYGLPMKLVDKEVNFVGSPKLVTFLNRKLWRVKVNYNLDQSGEYWQFYFDPKDYSLKVLQFFHPAMGADSEYILYSEEEQLNGLRMPTKHSWYMYNKKEFIGSEKLIKVSNRS